MNTKLWELKEMVDEMIEKHGDSTSLEVDISLAHPYEDDFRVRVILEGMGLNEFVLEAAGI